MTNAAYAQLLVLLKHCVSDNPPDEQVRRLSKGLVKALGRFLQMRAPDSTIQARSEAPRPLGLASVDASLASEPGDDSGEISRPQGSD